MLHRGRDGLANSHCSLGDGLELWLLSGSCTAAHKTWTRVPLCSDTYSLHRVNTSPSILGPEAEGMVKNTDPEEGQKCFLVLRKAKG